MRGDRKLRGVRLVGLVLTLLLVVSSIPPVAAGLHNDPARPVVPAQTQEGQTPPPTEAAGADADWWSAVQENIRRSEYQVTWQEQTYLDDVPAAYQAPNRAEGPFRGGLYDPVLDDGVKVNLLPLQEAGLLRYRKVV